MRASPTAGLPERVEVLVRMKDRESEYLLVLVQLILAATLGMLYLIAPRPADASPSFVAPVPLALIFYVSLIVLRAFHIRRAPLSSMAVALSIALDMTLLFGLVWSFHLVYDQPPAFSLKAPTFAYVFVFIAIRALRFDFRYVLMAGFTAAVGWALLTLGALAVSEPGTVTRNFSDYLLSNKILIGAEFDKIFAILALSAVLALATWRAERTLVAAVKLETATREIGRFLSRGVADQIASAAKIIEAGEAREREAAILFLDIRGFTRFSMTVPPAEVVALLTGFHARIVPIVRAHNGVVDKFLGDGVMVTFGAVEPSEYAAADAFRALEALMSEIAAWKAAVRTMYGGLDVNAGLAAGRIVFAALGDENRLEYTVIGESVNLAAKLEKHNKVENSIAVAPLEAFELALKQGFKPDGTAKTHRQAHVSGVSGAVDLVIWRAFSQTR